MSQLRVQAMRQFNQVASRRATKLGLGLTPPCLQLVDKMVATGVSRMENQRALDRQEYLIQAEQSLIKCIDALHEQANDLGTFPLVDEEAFARMQKKMSPLWPFC